MTRLDHHIRTLTARQLDQLIKTASDEAIELILKRAERRTK